MTATELRDHGMQLVIKHQGNEWSQKAESLVLMFLAFNGPSIMEEAREFCLQCGLDAPTHHNAWGALVGGLSKGKKIVMTGLWRRMTTAKSHARLTPEWRLP